MSSLDLFSRIKLVSARKQLDLTETTIREKVKKDLDHLEGGFHFHWEHFESTWTRKHMNNVAVVGALLGILKMSEDNETIEKLTRVFSKLVDEHGDRFGGMLIKPLSDAALRHSSGYGHRVVSLLGVIAKTSSREFYTSNPRRKRVIRELIRLLGAEDPAILDAAVGQLSEMCAVIAVPYIRAVGRKYYGKDLWRRK